MVLRKIKRIHAHSTNHNNYAPINQYVQLYIFNKFIYTGKAGFSNLNVIGYISYRDTGLPVFEYKAFLTIIKTCGAVQTDPLVHKLI